VNRASDAAPGAREVPTGQAGPAWTFLTNHAHVLLAIAGDPEVRMRDVATAVGVTERAVQMIVTDLEAGGYLTRARIGRRNHYTVNEAGRFRHPAESEHRIGELLTLFAAPAAADDGR
jgi:predicted ArsR family transcriptional regulator